MNYARYIQDATRTESLINEVSTSSESFLKAIKLFILSTQIIDLYKREIFYKKLLPKEELSKILQEIHALSQDDSDNSNKQVMDINSRVLHASLGFATEAGEIVEALVASIEGKKFDTINFMEELGDINWYQAIALDEMKLDLDEVLDRNIEKLRKRFPDKFSEKLAITRDLTEERKALEAEKSDK